MPARRPASPPEERAGTHAPCARPDARLASLLLLLPLLAACGEDVPAEDAGAASGSAGDLEAPRRLTSDGVERDEFGIPIDAPVPAEARRRIGEYLEAMQRPPLDETSDVFDRWIHSSRAAEAEMRAADESVGHAALHAFCGGVSDYTIVRWGLLRIGASTAPEAAAPLLRELMLQYGYRIDDRAEATLLYAQVDPEGYLEDAREYVLRHDRPRKTMPDDEFLVRGWVTACEELGRSPVPECADVATNLYMQPYARIVAVETLGEYPDDPIARAALETVIVESSGDGYLRRKAAQSIGGGFAREEACALFEQILAREVDLNFKAFLQTMVNQNCGGAYEPRTGDLGSGDLGSGDLGSGDREPNDE